MFPMGTAELTAVMCSVSMKVVYIDLSIFLSIYMLKDEEYSKCVVYIFCYYFSVFYTFKEIVNKTF